MRRTATVLVTVLVVLAAVVLTACGGGDTATSTAEPASDSAGGSRVPEVLRFTAPVVGGGELDATTLAGQPVAFWFWAPT